MRDSSFVMRFLMMLEILIDKKRPPTLLDVTWGVNRIDVRTLRGGGLPFKDLPI